MSLKYPKEYQILCDYPLEFIEEGFDVHNVKGFQDKEERIDFSMVARHKTFKYIFRIFLLDYSASKLFLLCTHPVIYTRSLSKHFPKCLTITRKIQCRAGAFLRWKNQKNY